MESKTFWTIMGILLIGVPLIIAAGFLSVALDLAKLREILRECRDSLQRHSHYKKEMKGMTEAERVHYVTGIVRRSLENEPADKDVHSALRACDKLDQAFTGK